MESSQTRSVWSRQIRTLVLKGQWKSTSLSHRPFRTDDFFGPTRHSVSGYFPVVPSARSKYIPFNQASQQSRARKQAVTIHQSAIPIRNGRGANRSFTPPLWSKNHQLPSKSAVFSLATAPFTPVPPYTNKMCVGASGARAAIRPYPIPKIPAPSFPAP
jgi:hypothetical protein